MQSKFDLPARALLSVMLLLIAAAAATAQPEGYSEVTKLQEVTGEKLSCWEEQGVYDAAKLALIKQKPECETIKKVTVDFADQTLVYFQVASDCHMRLWVRVFRVDAEKKYKIIINNIYGGCRASGIRNGWLVFEKPPQNYDIEILEVRVDRYQDANTFVFPDEKV